jgi:putative spermidine/putrescine transport system substrate-binding protein
VSTHEQQAIEHGGAAVTRRRFLATTTGLVALAAAGAPSRVRPVSAQAGSGGQVIVRALGGNHLAAVEKAIFKPFTEATGIKVVPVPSVAAQVLAQVQAGRAQVDVLDIGEVSTMFLEKNGALEPIPYDQFKLTNPQDLDAPMRRPSMLGNIYAATVLVYNTQAFKAGTQPKSWAEFWDAEKFPGPRTLADAKTGSAAELEFALLADGVPAAQLYPIDVERAFQSLSRIKRHIVKWWQTGPMSSELLERKEVVLGGIWNGRVQDLIDKGAPLAIEWNQAKRLRQFYSIVKGAPNRANAARFLDFALQPKVQAELTRYVAYGPANRQAHQYVRPEDARKLPSTPAHFAAGFDQDGVWWSENLEKVNERWQSWILG